MNNAGGPKVGKIPLTVFGGAVTEMAPADLPEGASPFDQDCDYLPGSVFSRGGRQNVVAFANSFAEDLAGVALSVPDGRAPNEQAWASPSSATLNIPGTYAAAVLNAQAGGPAGSQLDTAATASGAGVTISVTGTPTFAPEVAILLSVDQGSASPAPNPGSGTW